MSFDKLKRVRCIAATPFPAGLASSLPGKGGNITYLSVQTVIDMLNIAFGDSWSVTYTDPVLEPFSTQGNQFIRVKATLSVKTIDPQTGEPITIVREGFGVDKLKGNGGENVTKSAQSDALKKAASTFGIDAQLRRNNIEAQYFYQLYSEPVSLTWTNESMIAYRPEWEIIGKISSQYGLQPAAINAYVEKITEGRDKFLMPSNIKACAEKMQEVFPLMEEASVSTLAMPDLPETKAS